MYDLPIQKGKIDDHSTSGTRLPVYQSDNDIYSSEKKISKDKEEQDFRKLKDGQEVFTASQSIHRDDFIAVSLPKPEPEVEDEGQNLYQSHHEEKETKSKPKKSSRRREDRDRNEDRQNDTFNKSAYETRWDSEHYDDDNKRRSKMPKDKRRQDACCVLI